MSSTPGLLSSLRHRDHRLLRGAFTASAIGSWAYNVALTVWIIDETGSAAWVGASSAYRHRDRPHSRATAARRRCSLPHSLTASAPSPAPLDGASSRLRRPHPSLQVTHSVLDSPQGREGSDIPA